MRLLIQKRRFKQQNTHLKEDINTISYMELNLHEYKYTTYFMKKRKAMPGLKNAFRKVQHVQY